MRAGPQIASSPAIVLQRGGALVYAHDQADAVLKALDYAITPIQFCDLPKPQEAADQP